MKKIIFSLLIALSFCIIANAQKELWGVTRQSQYTDIQGNIIKFDINGENAITIHQFNFPTGKVPFGKLFLASNGKLYGTATYGGIGSTMPDYTQEGFGVIYEYDLNFDTYRVVHYFPNITGSAANPTSGLIEPIPGKLYGGCLGGIFFVYDLATETVTTLTHNYSFVAMGGIYSDLIKASNGFVYAVSEASYPCTNSGPNQPNQGSIIKINTTTNTAQRVGVFGCNSDITINAFGGFSMIEALPNKIFFITDSLMYIPSEGSSFSVGGIIEYNTVTNGLTQKFTFDPLNSLGYSPKSFVMGDNGNLYGVCEQGGDTFKPPFTSGLENKTGTVFEYNPTTNSIIKLTDFPPIKVNPRNIIKLSTGEFAGIIPQNGLYKYNTNSNALQFPDFSTYSDVPNQIYTSNLIEICRKPAYHFFDVDTFDACVGGTFSYDVQNINAITYQWKKNNQDVLGQTTGVLNLANLQATDAGDYTCLMTNECGTTTTMALHLTVNCLETNTVAALDKSIKLYPNPTMNWLNIELPKNIDILTSGCTITNLLGQIVYQSATADKIYVSHLQKGIYIVTVDTNFGKWNGKFVKE